MRAIAESDSVVAPEHGQGPKDIFSFKTYGMAPEQVEHIGSVQIRPPHFVGISATGIDVAPIHRITP